MKITAIIVVYNKEIKDSVTCECIKKFATDVDIIIVDNSTKPNSNELVCAERGYRYLSMNGNAGLSKAYNAAIEVSKGSDMYVLFDDDTEVPAEYFEVLGAAADANPSVDIFAPIVLGQDGVIYSPNNYNFMKNEFIASPDDSIDPARFNAIASCLAIRARVFEGYRFNEILFVDQVDQRFFEEQRERGSKCIKLEVVVHQNFYQRGVSLTPEQGWNRLRLRIVDLMRHARLKGGAKITLMGYAKCCGLGMQIARKTGSGAVFCKAVGLSTSLLLKPR